MVCRGARADVPGGMLSEVGTNIPPKMDWNMSYGGMDVYDAVSIIYPEDRGVLPSRGGEHSPEDHREDGVSFDMKLTNNSSTNGVVGPMVRSSNRKRRRDGMTSNEEPPLKRRHFE
jgi:hypothetical protein